MTAGDAVNLAALRYIRHEDIRPSIEAGLLDVDDPPRRVEAVTITGLTVYESSERLPANDAAVIRYPTEPVLSRLHHSDSDLIFAVENGPEGVTVRMVRFAERSGGDVLRAGLESAHPGVSVTPLDDLPEQPEGPSFMVWGWPARPVVDSRLQGASYPIDRMLRGLGPQDVMATYVIAQKLTERATESLLGDIEAAIREAEEGFHSGLPGLVRTTYLSELSERFTHLMRAASTGLWKVATVVCGPHARQAVDALTAEFSTGEAEFGGLYSAEAKGSDGTPAHYLDLGFSDGRIGEPAVGPYERFTDVHSILSTKELATLVHLPVEPHRGYSVTTRLGRLRQLRTASTRVGLEERIELGRLIADGVPSEDVYTLPTAALTGHLLVVGTTGSGKTTTLRSIIEQTLERGVLCTIVEPAKSDYLLDSRLRDAGMIPLDLGADPTLAFNPLMPGPGVRLNAHIDQLIAIFTLSLGLWEPLPALLEAALRATYEAYTWDLLTEVNWRHPGEAPASAYPPLGELADQAASVVARTGYKGEVRANVEGALLARLRSLTEGSVGRLLSGTGPWLYDLDDEAAVVNVAGFPDPREQQLLMGLHAAQLGLWLQAQGEASAPRRVLVIEEAHRLLREAERSASPETGNAAGAAVTVFGNLLAEARSSGLALVVVDQIPSALASETRKNTNTRIVHRQADAAEAQAMAASLGMAGDEWQQLLALGLGEAACLRFGDDRPAVVAIQAPPSSDTLAADPMHSAAAAAERVSARDMARRFLRDRTGRWRLLRFTASLGLDPASDDVLCHGLADRVAEYHGWPALVRLRRDSEAFDAYTSHLAASMASRWARAGGWATGAEEEFAGALYRVLRTALLGETRESVVAGDEAAQFRRVLVGLHGLERPYATCQAICDSAPCLYRHLAASVTDDFGYVTEWDSQAGTYDNAQQWHVFTKAAYTFLPNPTQVAAARDEFRRAGLCAGSHIMRVSGKRQSETIASTVANIAANYDAWLAAATTKEDPDEDTR